MVLPTRAYKRVISSGLPRGVIFLENQIYMKFATMHLNFTVFLKSHPFFFNFLFFYTSK